jgi:glycosyltransferase involved in cell wall biosynthesis
MEKLKIGISGTRGIPNSYGGFEQFAQYLSTGLAKKGHQVFVYNSSLHPYKENQWQGVHIIHCKDRGNKLGTAGQFFYDLNCINDSRKRNFDILLQLGYTSNSVWHKRWPKKTINIVNMDGLEWKRSKYSRLTKIFLKFAESWAAKHADYLIADSKGIQKYLLTKFKKLSTYISYGAEIFNNPDLSLLKKFDLSPDGYYLLIARMEPENNIEMIIKGYLLSGKQTPIVIIGNTSNKYGNHLQKKYKNEKIKFLGAIYDQILLNNLRFYSNHYFHGHSVGGTNPSLLEAMACRCRISAFENIFNKDILVNDAEYFSSTDEVSKILNLEADENFWSKRKEINLEKIRFNYNWGKIINDYENLMLEAFHKKNS